MTNIPPLSDVTIITVALGVFFLVVAFYKSIFHKRSPPAHTTLNQAQPSVQREDQPVKLADPFQQASVAATPQDAKPPQPAATFYPAYPKSATTTVSAFRQFNPQKEADPASTPTKNESSYEWE